MYHEVDINHHRKERNHAKVWYLGLFLLLLLVLLITLSLHISQT